MIFEKSSWKNQNRQTGFLACKNQLIFPGYTGSKILVRSRLKIQFVELDFSRLIFQKSSTDQQGVTDIESSQILKLTYIDQKEYIIRFFMINAIRSKYVLHDLQKLFGRSHMNRLHFYRC